MAHGQQQRLLRILKLSNPPNIKEMREKELFYMRTNKVLRKVLIVVICMLCLVTMPIVTSAAAVPQPQSFTAEKVGDSLVKLRWEAVTSAVSYNIYAISNITLDSIAIASTTSCDIILDVYADIEEGVNDNFDPAFFFRCSAVDINGIESKLSNGAVINMNPEPLDSPVLQYSIEKSGIQLNWYPIEGAYRYEIYCSKKPFTDLDYDLIGGSLGTSFLVTNVPKNETLYFVVRAIGDGSYSELSNVVCVDATEEPAVTPKPTVTPIPTVTPNPTVTVTPTATPVPKPTVIAKPIAPAGITATTSAAKAATISWKPVAGATGYEILRSNKKSSGFKSIKSLGVSATSFKDTSVVEGKTYYYKVRSKNSSGFTDSVVMTVKTIAKTTSLKAGKSGNNLKVSYKSAEKNFQIQVSRKKGSGYKNVATNNKKKSLTVKNSSIKKALKLKKGKSYNLYVRTRSFRVVNNKKVYGSWTTTKVIKNFKIK